MKLKKTGIIPLFILACLFAFLSARVIFSLETSKAETDNTKPLAEANPSGPPASAQVCVACHGVDGNSPAPAWPKIAGQREGYIIKELIEYRKGDKGKRFDPTMFGMVQNLSDQDIKELAAYFSSQKETPGTTESQFLLLGEKIYRGGNPKSGVPACIACHAPRGEGNGFGNFPKLSGQFAEYTADQLRKFKADTRANDTNAIMRDIAKKMTDQEIQAVSSYVAGLH